jgi:hypothetical protein
MAIPQVRESWPLLGKLPSRWPLQTSARSGQAASGAASNIYKAARPLREETLLRLSQHRLHAPRGSRRPRPKDQTGASANRRQAASTAASNICEAA